MDDKTKPLEGEVLPATDPAASALGHRDRPGRPPEMTPDVVNKLIVAFNNGYNITEACYYAGISRTMYYDWLQKDDQFSYKMSEAQSAIHRRAKTIIAEAINAGDVGTARWYLNARDPEFKAKGEIGPPEGQKATEAKLKEFMDDTDDGAYPAADTGADPAHDVSGEPVTPASAEGGTEVAPGPTDIS